MRRIKSFVSLSLMFALLCTTFSFAQITAIVANEKSTGLSYQYDLAELNAAYGEWQLDEMSDDAILYKDFIYNKQTIAFYDSIKGYVDSNDVNNAYAEAQLEGGSFNPHEYAEKIAKAADESAISSIKGITVDENGQLVEEELDVPNLPNYEFKILESVIPGTKQVYVIFAEDVDGSNYEATINGVPLEYEADKNRFKGTVQEAYANESYLKVTEKENSDVFELIDIY